MKKVSISIIFSLLFPLGFSLCSCSGKEDQIRKDVLANINKTNNCQINEWVHQVYDGQSSFTSKPFICTTDSLFCNIISMSENGISCVLKAKTAYISQIHSLSKILESENITLEEARERIDYLSRSYEVTLDEENDLVCFSERQEMLDKVDKIEMDYYYSPKIKLYSMSGFPEFISLGNQRYENNLSDYIDPSIVKYGIFDKDNGTFSYTFTKEDQNKMNINLSSDYIVKSAVLTIKDNFPITCKYEVDYDNLVSIAYDYWIEKINELNFTYEISKVNEIEFELPEGYEELDVNNGYYLSRPLKNKFAFNAQGHYRFDSITDDKSMTFEDHSYDKNRICKVCGYFESAQRKQFSYYDPKSDVEYENQNTHGIHTQYIFFYNTSSLGMPHNFYVTQYHGNTSLLSPKMQDETTTIYVGTNYVVKRTIIKEERLSNDSCVVLRTNEYKLFKNVDTGKYYDFRPYVNNHEPDYTLIAYDTCFSHLGADEIDYKGEYDSDDVKYYHCTNSNCGLYFTNNDSKNRIRNN